MSAETLTDLVARFGSVPEERGLTFVSPRFEETRWSWARLHERVARQAGAFREQGVRAGDHVVLPLTSEEPVVTAFFALAWLGAVPVSVGGQMAGQAREAYVARIGRLRARHAFQWAILDRRLREAAVEAGALEPECFLELAGGSQDSQAAAAVLEPHPAGPEDVAFIQFSSGSTEEPKGVEIRHGNVCSNLRWICEHDGRGESSNIVTWVPLYHDMGLVGGLLSAVYHAHDAVLLHPVGFLMRPLSWLEALSRHGGTVSACPNFALDMCVSRIRDRQLEAAGLDLSRVSFIWNGAEPVNPESVRRFEARFAPHGLRPGSVQPAYGLAEASLAVSARPAGAPLKTRRLEDTTAVSVGRPLGDFEVRIASEEGEPLPVGRVGEILLRGRSVTSGYHADPEATRERFRDGWLRVGDLGFVDEEGELFVTGRSKDLIIVRGRNFYGHDVAARLGDLPFLEAGQSHVFGVGGEDGERVVVMTVVSRAAARAGLRRLGRYLDGEEGSWIRGEAGARASGWVEQAIPSEIDALRDEIRRYLLEQLGLPVDDVVIVRRIPRTPSGKIRRKECEKIYLDEVAARGAEE